MTEDFLIKGVIIGLILFVVFIFAVIVIDIVLSPPPTTLEQIAQQCAEGDGRAIIACMTQHGVTFKLHGD